jgi:hypothetical protein
MIFTTEMIQLFAVVLAKDRDRLTEALLREGVMQFIDISEVGTEKSGNLSSVEPEIPLTEVSDLRKRVEGFLYTSGIIPSAPKETDLKNRVSVDMEKEKKRLDKIAFERDSIREKQRIIQQEILKLDDIRRQVELYGLGLSDIKLPGKQSFLSIQTGKLPVINVKKLESELQDLPSLNIELGRQEGVAHHLLISMKRDKERINKILASTGWSEIELPEELKGRCV